MMGRTNSLLKCSMLLLSLSFPFVLFGLPWTSLSQVARNEIAIRIVENASFSWQLMRTTACEVSVSQDAAHGVRPGCARLLFAKFTPVMREVSFLPHEDEMPEVGFVANPDCLMTHCVGRNREDYGFYRPSMPRDGLLLAGLFRRLNQRDFRELVGRSNAHVGVESESQEQLISAVESKDSDPHAWEKASVLEYEKGCLFIVSEDVLPNSIENKLYVTLSYREVSELLYVALGDQEYRKHASAQYLVCADELKSLVTDIGREVLMLMQAPEKLVEAKSAVKKFSETIVGKECQHAF